MDLRKSIEESIGNYGHKVIGVMGGELQPTFSYTVGLTSKYGCEFLMCGLRADYACAILNDIAAAWSPAMIGQENTDFTNLPLAMMECDKDLKDLHDLYVCQADAFYGKEVKVIQVLMADPQGRTPLSKDFDHEYMSRFQRIFVNLTK